MQREMNNYPIWRKIEDEDHKKKTEKKHTNKTMI